MSLTEELEIMKSIQKNLLDLIDEENEIEECYQNILHLFEDYKIKDDQCFLISILLLISKISDNHNRSINFFEKIMKIILYFKEPIKNNISNLQIFNIFKENKRLLLSLIEEKIIFLDENIISKISSTNYQNMGYSKYFSPEIKIYEKKESEKTENFDDFNKKRKIGENDRYFLQLIQKDLIEEFIIFVNKNDYSLKSTINPSIFETNLFLIGRKTSLIEYSAFYGSIQIFNYLRLNNVKLKPSLWIYAIHGNNPEIIHLLEENKVEPDDDTYKECYEEAIKCFHNEIAFYIKENLLKSDEIEKNDNFMFKFYNFSFINEDDIIKDENSIVYLVRYGYVFLMKHVLKSDLINKYKLLIEAIENEQVEIIKIILYDSKTDVNIEKIQQIDYYIDDDDPFVNEAWEKIFPLYIAIKKENYEIVKLLLSHENIDINKKYILSSKLNEIDNEKNYEEDFIEEKIEDISSQNNKYKDVDIDIYWIEKTALHLAIKESNSQIVQLLINNPNIDVNAKLLKYYSFKKYNEYSVDYVRGNFYFTDDGDDYEVVLYKNRILKSTILLAIEKFNDDIEIIESLVRKTQIDVNFGFKHDVSLLYIYCYQKTKNCHDSFGYSKLLNLSRTPLFFSIENDRNEIIDILLKSSHIKFNLLSNDRYGDEIYNLLNEKRDNFLLFLSYKPYADKGVDPSNDEYFGALKRGIQYSTDVELAIKKGKIQVIKCALSDQSFDVNERPLLYTAIKYETKDAVKLLLNHPKIDVNMQSDNCEAPLIIAIKYVRIDILKLLLNHPKIDINIKSKDGKSALSIAVKKENIEIVQLLLDHPGIEIDFDHIFENISNKLLKIILLILKKKKRINEIEYL